MEGVFLRIEEAREIDSVLSLLNDLGKQGSETYIDEQLFGGRDYTRLICAQSKAVNSDVGFIYREIGNDTYYQITDEGRAFLTSGGYTALRESDEITDRPPRDM